MRTQSAGLWRPGLAPIAALLLLTACGGKGTVATEAASEAASAPAAAPQAAPPADKTGGFDANYVHEVAWIPEYGITVVILQNGARRNINTLTRDVAESAIQAVENSRAAGPR